MYLDVEWCHHASPLPIDEPFILSILFMIYQIISITENIFLYPDHLPAPQRDISLLDSDLAEDLKREMAAGF